MPRALVAGAGIGGLGAALALGASGFAVTVFERQKTLSELGAGIQLTPNAVRALKALGAYEAVAKAAYAPDAIVIKRGRDGDTLARLPLQDAEVRWGAPYLALHRADLQAGLLESVLRQGKTRFALEREISGVAADGAEMVLGVKRGLLSLSERADCVVGADGLWSKLRERLGLGGPEDVTPLGMTAFRAMVPFGKAETAWMKPEITVSLGADAHLVHYPLPARRLVNVIGVVRAPEAAGRAAGYDTNVASEDIAAHFARWGAGVRTLIASAETWRAWPLFDRPQIAALATGRVALLGDAAHPMAPFLAQGAAMALEDCAALLAAFKAHGEVGPAFAAYSAARAARSARVQREARRQGDIYHHRGLMAFGRNAVMRALGAKRLLARYDWLYGEGRG